MAIIFNVDGSIANIDENTADKAFIGKQEIPFISGAQLRSYAATVYSESSHNGILQYVAPSNTLGEMQRETFAIAYSMYSYALAKSAAFKKAKRSYGLADLLVDSNYTKGINSPQHQEYFGTTGDKTRREQATLAVIKLFTKQTADVVDVIQALQGGGYWDGSDIFRKFPDHYRCRQGFELSNTMHGNVYKNIPNVAKTIESCPATEARVSAQRQFTFMSTMTAGGSIFFKLHPNAVAQGISW
jgi:hypothetical protein